MEGFVTSNRRWVLLYLIDSALLKKKITIIDLQHGIWSGIPSSSLTSILSIVSSTLRMIVPDCFFTIELVKYTDLFAWDQAEEPLCFMCSGTLVVCVLVVGHAALKPPPQFGPGVHRVMYI